MLIDKSIKDSAVRKSFAFTGENFTIYSGSAGDVILREDSLWISLPDGFEFEMPTGDLQFALNFISYSEV